MNDLLKVLFLPIPPQKNYFDGFVLKCWILKGKISEILRYPNVVKSWNIFIYKQAKEFNMRVRVFLSIFT